MRIDGRPRGAVRPRPDLRRPAQRPSSAANSNQPTGTLRGERQRVTIEATGQMRRADDYRDLIVSSRNGVPVRLDDVADVQGLRRERRGRRAGSTTSAR